MNNHTDLGEVYLYGMDDEGNPIPETKQKLGNIEHIDISAEEGEQYTVVRKSPSSNPVVTWWTETIDTEIAVEIETNKLKNKQRHYDETHSRKSNWHKRYF